MASPPLPLCPGSMREIDFCTCNIKKMPKRDSRGRLYEDSTSFDSYLVDYWYKSKYHRQNEFGGAIGLTVLIVGIIIYLIVSQIGLN